MARNNPSVLGVIAPRARPTLAGAVWLAAIMALPAGLLGIAIEVVVRWLF